MSTYAYQKLINAQKFISLMRDSPKAHNTSFLKLIFDNNRNFVFMADQIADEFSINEVNGSLVSIKNTEQPVVSMPGVFVKYMYHYYLTETLFGIIVGKDDETKANLNSAVPGNPPVQPTSSLFRNIELNRFTEYKSRLLEAMRLFLTESGNEYFKEKNNHAILFFDGPILFSINKYTFDQTYIGKETGDLTNENVNIYSQYSPYPANPSIIKDSVFTIPVRNLQGISISGKDHLDLINLMNVRTG